MHLFALIVALVPNTVQLLSTNGAGVRNHSEQGTGGTGDAGRQMRKLILRPNHKKEFAPN